ncbi:MAG TPA: alpha/beta fold hydrolase [Actinoplanes sp.]|nr:alpha/beta fold hydrolase [Actinoplanes sp.]
MVGTTHRADPVRGARSRAVRSAAVVLAAVAVGFLAGRDGSPPWQVARVVAVAALAFLTVTVIRRGPAWLGGAAAYGAGVVTTAIGAGIGLPHLSKAGWTPVTVAGLLALSAGILLLVCGAAMVVRRTRRWWRLAVVPALLVISVVSLWSGTTAVAATNVPPTALEPATPESHGLAYLDVALPTGDGVQLSAWYVPSANRAAVILLHGAGSTRSAVLAHAVVLARHGYGVLLPDARGHGRSGGRAMDFGWYGDPDVAAALSFLESRADVDPARIAAVGLSMGGEQAIGAAAGDARLRAVVAEGATNRVAGDKAFLAEAYGMRGRIQNGIDALTYTATDLLTATGPPITLRAAAGSAAPRPILLIAAGNVPTEAQAARHIQRGHSNVQVWQAPGAGHTRALSTHPGEWEQQVTEFLAAALPA